MDFEKLCEVEPSRPATDVRPAAGPVYRVAYAKEGAPKIDGLETLHDNFQRSVRKHPNRPCLGYRKIVNNAAQSYEWLTYAEVGQVVKHVACGYAALGLKPQDKAGILGANTPEWMMAMQACSQQNLTCVPIYDTLGENAVEFIMKHSEAKLVLTSAAKLKLVLAAIPSVKEQVKAVVYWGDVAAAELEAAKATGVNILSFDDLADLGKSSPSEPSLPSKSDYCTIMYTSGTTGDPKGVLITHDAVLATISGAEAYLHQHKLDLGPDDVFFSYLPLAHIFGRVAEEMMLNRGASIGYWQGDSRKILEDVEVLKPTFFAGVPRVFDRVYSGVREQVQKAGGLKAVIFNLAYQYKKFWMQLGFPSQTAAPLADLIVFNKIKAKLGGRTRILLSGGAPLGPECEEFLKVVMSCAFAQGYGLTESCAASFLGEPMGILGTVGPPTAQTDLRLEAVPEMGYDPLDYPPKGEVCLKGRGIFAGYFKAEEQTKEVIDEDGFFHTGDIGELKPDGSLRIIDRKKNIFKLSQGEYIAVERVENVYKNSLLVEQIWVYGNSFESCVVGVVVPKESTLRPLAESLGIKGSFQELCTSEELKKAALKEMQQVGRAKGLKGFEEIKALILETEPFSTDNDLMTPSFKLKRVPLLKHYQKDIDAMYAALNKPR